MKSILFGESNALFDHVCKTGVISNIEGNAKFSSNIEGNANLRQIFQTIHSTTHPFLKLTLRELERGLAPPRASGASATRPTLGAGAAQPQRPALRADAHCAGRDKTRRSIRGSRCLAGCAILVATAALEAITHLGPGRCCSLAPPTPAPPADAAPPGDLARRSWAGCSDGRLRATLRALCPRSEAA